MRHRSILYFLLIALLCHEAAQGQDDKQTLTSAAYSRWSSIDDVLLSDDGNWAIYSSVSAVGESTLVARATHKATEYRVPRGGPMRRTSVKRRTAISADSRFVIFTIATSQAFEAGGVDLPDRTAEAEVSLGILRLSDGRVTTINHVARFELPTGKSSYLGYLTSASYEQNSGLPALVLRDLASNKEKRIESVSSFEFDRTGCRVAYTIEIQTSVGEDGQSSGAYIRELVSGETRTLSEGSGHYGAITFDSIGAQIAFISDRNEFAKKRPRHEIYYATSGRASAVVVVAASDVGAGRELAAGDGVQFSRDGNALTFGVTPSPQPRSSKIPRKNARSVIESEAFDPQTSIEEPDVQAWHWQEAWPTNQGFSAGTEVAEPSLLAAYLIAARRVVALGTAKAPIAYLSDDARHAVGMSTNVLHNWQGLPAWDVYLIDVYSGERSLLQREMQLDRLPYFDRLLPRYPHCGVRLPIQSNVACQPVMLFSPGGRFLLYLQQGRWWSVNLHTKAIVDVTGRLLPGTRFDAGGGLAPASFSLDGKGQFGTPAVAGWTAGDTRVLIYGQRDIWEFDPEGREEPRNVTHGVGAHENIVFRLWNDYGWALDYPLIADTKGMLTYDADFPPAANIESHTRIPLMAVDLDTMSTGFWEVVVDSANPPRKLIMIDKRVTPVARSRRASQFLVTQQRFDEFPDLWTGSRLDNLQKISNVNPQQREFRWGSVELVNFTSDFGVPLKGRLYKPFDFDPRQQYPMVVAFYEISSQYLHLYDIPQALRTSPALDSWPAGVSRGYLYFWPDVMPAAPYPAQSALAAVVPAVRSIVERGYVDPARIALAGHSYGAFEAAFVLSQTSIFCAAVIDGAITNMLTLYASQNGGPWYTEMGQGRLGGSLWEKPWVYLANSPVLFANTIHAPILMMNGAEDELAAQGMELFSALRRNGKEVYYVRYQGEGHGLGKAKNRLDWDGRVNGFLDYLLKNGARPLWMDAQSRPSHETPVP